MRPITARFAGHVRRLSSSQRWVSVVEEADETVFWLELLIDTAILSQTRMNGLLTEANELLAIFAASQRTARMPNDSMKKWFNDSMTQ